MDNSGDCSLPKWAAALFNTEGEVGREDRARRRGLLAAAGLEGTAVSDYFIVTVNVRLQKATRQVVGPQMEVRVNVSGVQVGEGMGEGETPREAYQKAIAQIGATSEAFIKGVLMSEADEAATGSGGIIKPS